MLAQYFDVDVKRIGYFFGLVIGAVIIVSLIYLAIFGFDRWQGGMQGALDLMTAAVAAPSGQGYSFPSSAGQYVCPRDSAVGLPNFDGAGIPHCPVCGQVMSFHNALARNMTLSAGFGRLPPAGPGGMQNNMTLAAGGG